MKTKYFIQKLEDFGFVANVDREVIIIKNKNIANTETGGKL